MKGRDAREWAGRHTLHACHVSEGAAYPADAEEFRTKPAEYRYNGRTRVRFDSAHLDDLSWMLFVYNTANNNCRWGTSMIFVGIKNDPGDFMNYVEPFKVYSTAKDR